MYVYSNSTSASAGHEHGLEHVWREPLQQVQPVSGRHAAEHDVQKAGAERVGDVHNGAANQSCALGLVACKTGSSRVK